MMPILYSKMLKTIYTYVLNDEQLDLLTTIAQNSVTAWHNSKYKGSQNANTVEGVLPGIIGEWLVAHYLWEVHNIEANPIEVNHYSFNITPAQVKGQGDVVAVINGRRFNYEVKTIKSQHPRSQVRDIYLNKYVKDSDGVWFVSYDEATKTATIYGYVCIAEFKHEVSLFERKLSNKPINPMRAFAYWTGNNNPNMIGGFAKTKFEQSNIVMETVFVPVAEISSAIGIPNDHIFPDSRNKYFYSGRPTDTDNTRSAA